MFNDLPWKQTKIILLFLRLQPSTPFWTLVCCEVFNLAISCVTISKLHGFMDLMEKISFIPISKKGNATECPNSAQLCSFHMLARLCSKFFKLDFSSMRTVNFQMYKLGFQKAEEQRSNCQHLLDHGESKRVPKKHLLLLH